MIESIGAVTLATHDMPRAVRFYRALGTELVHGGEASPFTTLRAGSGHLNLASRPAQQRRCWWGRVIFHVADVDALYNVRARGGMPPDHRAPRRRMGGTLLPPDRPGGQRTNSASCGP